MRFTARTLVLAMSVAAAPLTAQQWGPQPDATTRAEILRIRDAAWRTWFSNDAQGFQRIVPDELVALGWGGGPWEDRATTLASMAQFAQGGQTIKSLEFPRNLFQRYGDVVILYSDFHLVLVKKDGQTSDTIGRGSEVFVRRNGRWIHTAWHLDNIKS